MIERTDLLEDARFKTPEARKQNRGVLEELIEKIFLERPHEEWLRRLKESRLPYGEVRGIGQVLAHPLSDRAFAVSDRCCLASSKVRYRTVLTLKFYVADRVAVQLNRPDIGGSVAAFRRVDVRGPVKKARCSTTQAAQDVPSIGISERLRADIAKTAEHVQLHTHVRHRLSSERCRFEDRPRQCRSVVEQFAGQMGTELGWINDGVNVEVGVASCGNCGDTRLIGSERIGIHADQRAGRGP